MVTVGRGNLLQGNSVQNLWPCPIFDNNKTSRLVKGKYNTHSWLKHGLVSAGDTIIPKVEVVSQ